MKNQTFNDLFDSIKELHDKKNHDYAFEFAAQLVKLFTDPVDQVFAGRIGDKLARLGQLLSGKEPNFESVEDTMRDITCLAGIWTAWRMDHKMDHKFDADPGIIFEDPKTHEKSYLGSQRP